MADIAEARFRESLGLYVLGALVADESDKVERHLLGCPACQRELDVVAEAAAALTVLTPEDERTVLARYATPVRRPRRGGPVRTATPARSDPPAPGRRGLPAKLRRRRNRMLLSIGGLAAVVVLSVGIVLGSLLGGSDGGGSTSITLAATAVDPVSGATLSVSIAGDQSSVSVHAIVTGRVDGGRYQLYAVDTNGNTTVVATWIGSAGVRELTGTLQVGVDALSFFTVTQFDGAPVVSAYLHHASPSAT